MLMEFALESDTPCSRQNSGEISVKMRLTPVWAWSKLPEMAHTPRFCPAMVVICAR